MLETFKSATRTHNAVERPLHGVVELRGVVLEDIGVGDVAQVVTGVPALVRLQVAVVALHIWEEMEEKKTVF